MCYEIYMLQNELTSSPISIEWRLYMRLPTSGYDSNQDISTPGPEDHAVEEVDTTKPMKEGPRGAPIDLRTLKIMCSHCRNG